jgi:serine/threonine-protein kinase
VATSGPARDLERNCPRCGRVFPGGVEFCPDDGSRLVDHTLRAKPKDDEMVGRVLDGKYRIESVLGRGGMGVVYASQHTILGKRVAIKVLRGQFDEDPEILSRFTQEARAASAIGSAHIIDITDFGDLEGGAAYFVMEYLDGEPLSAFMKRTGPVAPDRAASIVEQICRGLQAAHDHGIVHRDLKPDNVFLLRRDDRSDFVKILDFGIAKVAGAAGPRTKSGMVFGTPHYMAPEQAAGDPVDGRTDVYALGVILFELLVGKVPFDADSFMAILTKHMYQPPPALSSVHADPSRPPSLDEIVIKAMAKVPAERWQSMDELRAALLAVVPLSSTGNMLVGSGPRPIDVATRITPTTGPRPSMALPVAGRRARIALFAGLPLLLLVGGAVYFAQSPPSPVPVAPAGLAVPAAPAGPVGLPAHAPALAPATPSPSEIPAPPIPAPAPTVVRVRILSSPMGATVWDGQTSLGPTPLELDRPELPRELVLRADGHQPQTIQIGPDSAERVDVTLSPARSVRTGGGGGGGGGQGGGGGHRTTKDGELHNPFDD